MKMTPEDARAVARQYWGINAFATILKSEWGGTFNLTADTGEAYILKVAPSHLEALRIELEAEAVEHISKRKPHVSFPNIVRSNEGSIIQDTPFGKARIYTWIEGRLWSDVKPHTEDLFKSLGQKLGVLKNALKTPRIIRDGPP